MARSVNTFLTTTYWQIGERLVEHEQGGEDRAAYGAKLLKRLSHDLGSRLGRGFSERNLEQIRHHYKKEETCSGLPLNPTARIFNQECNSSSEMLQISRNQRASMNSVS
ncbi:MAG: DUF1016 N-terminal domain-containing protein [Acidobacteriota bacterium]|nr:DUF1016 N-terminal domain-containing protein [Acidobacteriota bacterium]